MADMSHGDITSYLISLTPQHRPTVMQKESYCLEHLEQSILGGAYEETQCPEIDLRGLRWNKGVCKVRLGHSKVPCIA